nr:uncharacterized protein LOC123774489 [Procambarus clarkii]
MVPLCCLAPNTALDDDRSITISSAKPRITDMATDSSINQDSTDAKVSNGFPAPNTQDSITSTTQNTKSSHNLKDSINLHGTIRPDNQNIHRSQDPLIIKWSLVRESDFENQEAATNHDDQASFGEKKKEVVKVSQISTVGSVADMASILIKDAMICLSSIDDFKDDFVMSTLHMSWEDADEQYPPGTVEEPFLPDLPDAGSYSPLDFNYELVRIYGLMQHYTVALEFLSLDQSLYSNVSVQQIDQVDRNLNVLMLHMKNFIGDQGLQPDNNTTEKLVKMTYERGEETSRNMRDFEILRDIKNGLLHLNVVFSSYI